MDFDGLPTIGLDGHQWAMATTAYICSRLYTQPPMYRATYMMRNICATFAQCCAMLRSVAQHCANVAHHCATLRTFAQHCATLRKCCATLRKCCAAYKYTYMKST